MTPRALRHLEMLIVRHGVDGRLLTWCDLRVELLNEGIDLGLRSIQNWLGSLHFRRCIAYSRSRYVRIIIIYLLRCPCFISEHHKRRRLEWARLMLERYPEPSDWHRVRFSDEVHFGYGPEMVPRVLRRPWERGCSDCAIERRDSSDKEQKKIHAWGAIGFNFKSDLVFYEVNSNSNGKMSQDVYINQILTPHVLPWILRGDDFVLEEDGDSGHGPSDHNKVRTWKQKNGLESYFNCSQSPDLAPIENAWFPVKNQVRKAPHWDAEATIKLAVEGWLNISQDTVNKWVESMPNRLRQLIRGGGKLTAY